MRFDQVITFHTGTPVYNPTTGKYDESDAPFKLLGNVTDVGTNRSIELFGKVDTSNKVIRLASPITKNWTYLTLPNDTAHLVKVTSRQPLKGNTLIVGEDHG